MTVESMKVHGEGRRHVAHGRKWVLGHGEGVLGHAEEGEEGAGRRKEKERGGEGVS